MIIWFVDLFRKSSIVMKKAVILLQGGGESSDLNRNENRWCVLNSSWICVRFNRQKLFFVEVVSLEKASFVEGGGSL